MSQQTLALEFSPDASLLGCACDDGSVRVWKVSFINENSGSVTNQFGKNLPRPDPLAGTPGYTPLDPVPMVRCAHIGVAIVWSASLCVYVLMFLDDCLVVFVFQLITRDSLIIMRERHVATTTAPASVAEHFVTSLHWSPNQRMIATLSASPRIRIWRTADALKGHSDSGEAFGNNGECLTALHGHLRYGRFAGTDSRLLCPFCHSADHVRAVGPSGWLLATVLVLVLVLVCCSSYVICCLSFCFTAHRQCVRGSRSLATWHQLERTAI